MIRLRVDSWPCVVTGHGYKEPGGESSLFVSCGSKSAILTPDHPEAVAIIEATPEERELLSGWGFGHLPDATQIDRYMAGLARRGAGKGLKNPRKRNHTSRTKEWWAEWRRKKAGQAA